MLLVIGNVFMLHERILQKPSHKLVMTDNTRTEPIRGSVFWRTLHFVDSVQKQFLPLKILSPNWPQRKCITPYVLSQVYSICSVAVLRTLSRTSNSEAIKNAKELTFKAFNIAAEENIYCTSRTYIKCLKAQVGCR